MEKKTGFLVFDVNFGKFGIAESQWGSTFDIIEFGATFEVKVDDKWVETCLEITSDSEHNLLFKLKGTDMAGDLNGLEIRV